MLWLIFRLQDMDHYSQRCVDIAPGKHEKCIRYIRILGDEITPGNVTNCTYHIH